MIEGNEVLKVHCYGVKGGSKYPQSVRQFCLTMHTTVQEPITICEKLLEILCPTSKLFRIGTQILMFQERPASYQIT